MIARRRAAAGAIALLAGCADLGGVRASGAFGSASAGSRAPRLDEAPAGSRSARSGDAPLAPPDADTPPPLPREFRAAWVATVSNIDWPSAPGLPASAQRADALALLDKAQTIGLNALILQVRPAGDAIYPSALEPWSEYLSGEQGRAPWRQGEASWDPLAFWVDQAHRRGIELHAWFNPYRARHSTARSRLAAQHLALRQPALALRYGDMLWFDPGAPAAAAHTLAVVADVVRRYDVDGVHLDDYFYPYPVPGASGVDLPFPDDATWARYQLGGGTAARDDWRRANVDVFVQSLDAAVHAIKPWVRVGISPFGLGRPDRRPPGVSGFSQYDRLYADVERWLAAGWLDYLAPQLYWPIASPAQPFGPLLDYWIGASTAQRPVWPGLFTSQVMRPGEAPGPRTWPAREITDQVALQRERAAFAGAPPGHLHFSAQALLQDRDGIAALLRSQAYAQPALVPVAPWLGAAPPQPGLRAAGARVDVEPGVGPAAARWAVWRRNRAAGWRWEIRPGHERSFNVAGAEAVAVVALARSGAAAPPAILPPLPQP